jgi:hypothetical protein
MNMSCYFSNLDGAALQQAEDKFEYDRFIAWCNTFAPEKITMANMRWLAAKYANGTTVDFDREAVPHIVESVMRGYASN